MDVDPNTRSDVEAGIRAAFDGVKLGRGVSIRQSQVVDKYGVGVSDAEFEEIPATEVTDSWSALPLVELDRACVAHFDPEGLRYYLPALMLSVLDSFAPSSLRVIGTLSALDARQPYNQLRYTLLTGAQKTAIARFLTALPELVQLGREDGAAIDRSRRSYWDEFVERIALAPNYRLERP